MTKPALPYHKLTTLNVSVVRWDDSQHWCKPLTDFIPEFIRQRYKSYDPDEYLWADFEDFLIARLRFEPEVEVVVFCPYSLEGKDTRKREVTDECVWVDLMIQVAKNKIVVSEYGQLCFTIVPRKDPGRTPSPEDWQHVADAISADWIHIQPPRLKNPRPSNNSRRTCIEILEYEAYSDEEDTINKEQITEDGAVAALHKFVYQGVDSDESEEEMLASDSESNYSRQGETVMSSAPLPKAAVFLAEKSTTPPKAASTPTTRGSATTRGRSTTHGTPPTRSAPSTRNTPAARGTASARSQLPSRPTSALGTHPNTRATRGTRGSRGTTRRTRPATPARTKPTTKPSRTPSPTTATTTTTTTTGTTTPEPKTDPTSPLVNNTPAATYLNLVDLVAAEYQTASTADTDYGALDLGTTVDAYVGSYNTGDSDAEWSACLEFFKIDGAEYRRRETTAAGGGARKRVPMKKLPGMAVGLFDYQLMGMFKLVSFVLGDVSGGLLCDEQGLGKTQEMYGAMAFAHALRKCKAEVKAAWKKSTQHNAPLARGARSCPFDERYGFRCYCYSELTRELADRLPEGPNIVVAPARSCAAMVRDAKMKLDTKVFKIRGFHEGGDKEDKLAPAEAKTLRATITGTEDNYKYQASAGQSDYIIIVSPEFIPRLNSQFGVDVAGAKTKKSALLPGMILMDEFHEYAIAKEGEVSRTIAWLQHLKKCCLDSDQPTPLTYFVSGTPLGETPADIRPTISLLEKEAWQGEGHPLNGAIVASFNDLVDTFDRLSGIQASGEALATSDIIDYRRRLDRVLKHTVVRRLGTDQFQGRNLTDIGPLKVNITDHNLPFPLTDSMQGLANQTRDLAIAAAAKQGIPLTRFLRSKAGEAIFLKLRLASTFPGIAATTGSNFTFTPSEIHTHLTAAEFDVTKTPYHPHIPAWSATSPKLKTLTQSITVMLADKTPVPGAPSSSKKLCIFTPLEAEAVLLQSYLLLKRTHPSFRNLKPILLHSSLSQTERQRVLDNFLTEGNAPPNVLIAPLALAGTGLNLQRARYSTVTGPAWTKRENQQAYYRIHRVGQRLETRLALLTARWNPAERMILAGYEGKGVEGDGLGKEVWEVGNWFCAGEGGGKGGLVERHQAAE